MKMIDKLTTKNCLFITLCVSLFIGFVAGFAFGVIYGFICFLFFGILGIFSIIFGEIK